MKQLKDKLLAGHIKRREGFDQVAQHAAHGRAFYLFDDVALGRFCQNNVRRFRERILRHPHQVSERHAQGAGNPDDVVKADVCHPPDFNVFDVGPANAGPLRQICLRYAEVAPGEQHALRQ